MDYLLHFIICFIILIFTRSWPIVTFCILGKEFYDLEIQGGVNYLESWLDISAGLSGAFLAAWYLDKRNKNKCLLNLTHLGYLGTNRILIKGKEAKADGKD